MTEQERTEFYNKKHNEICNELLGKEKPYSESNEIEVKFVDKNWNSGKDWHDKARILDHMNLDSTGIRKYQEQINTNSGVIVTIVEDAPLSKTIEN